MIEKLYNQQTHLLTQLDKLVETSDQLCDQYERIVDSGDRRLIRQCEAIECSLTQIDNEFVRVSKLYEQVTEQLNNLTN